MRQVYLDHAATTPVSERVMAAMAPFFSLDYGNPSSFHGFGKTAKDAVEVARQEVAAALGARPDEIIFTSGGTESDALAILGAARAHGAKGKHIITTKTEHPAVLEAAEHLRDKEGFSLTVLETDKYGRVSAAQIMEAIRPETILVSVILANNEIGTLNPIQEIGQAIINHKKENKTIYPIFHTDACQALGAMELAVDALHVDLLTVNAGKIYGPKGAGALFIKRGIKVQPLLYGGFQERGIRPGTENVAAIIGLAEAVKESQEMCEEESVRQTELRDYFISKVLQKLSKIRLNGHPTERLPNNINLSFMDVEGEALLLYLDAKGIYASTGSACTSASLDPSHVILALGVPYEVAHGSLRFTLGRSTTKEDLDYVLAELPELVEKLRRMSPVNVDPKYYE